MKCHTGSCEDAGAHRVFWPGADPPLLMCDACTLRARRLALAMGFRLVTEWIDRPAFLDAQKEGAPEGEPSGASDDTRRNVT